MSSEGERLHRTMAPPRPPGDPPPEPLGDPEREPVGDPAREHEEEPEPEPNPHDFSGPYGPRGRCALGSSQQIADGRE